MSQGGKGKGVSAVPVQKSSGGEDTNRKQGRGAGGGGKTRQDSSTCTGNASVHMGLLGEMPDKRPAQYKTDVHSLSQVTNCISGKIAFRVDILATLCSYVRSRTERRMLPTCTPQKRAE